MFDKVITFCIAAYNVEKYIKKVLESLVKIKGSDFEILVINDGSTDDTLKIAKFYEEKYGDVIRVINQENKGHGGALNTGIREAHGKYFRAVDGDDWVDTTEADKLLELLRTENEDMILSNFIEYYEDGKTIKRSLNNLKDGKVYSFSELYDKKIKFVYHNVIFKTSILKSFKKLMTENCFYVDMEYICFPVKYVNTIKYFDVNIYCYRIGREGQSISEEGRKKNISDICRASYSLSRWFEKNKYIKNKKKRKFFKIRASDMCSYYYQTILMFSPDNMRKKELMMFDRHLKSDFREIYDFMETEEGVHNKGLNRRIIQMRRSHYLVYEPYGICRKIKRVAKMHN